MSKSFIKNLKLHCVKVLAVALCFGSFMSVSQGAVFAQTESEQPVSKDEDATMLGDKLSDLKKKIGEAKLEKISDKDLGEAVDKLKTDGKIKETELKENLESKVCDKEKSIYEERSITGGKLLMFLSLYIIFKGFDPLLPVLFMILVL